MNRGTSRLPFRIAICAALAALAVLVLAACGSDSSQELAFELTGKGKDAKVSGPESADTGEAKVTFTNESDQDGELQFIRAEGDHSAEEVIKGLEGAESGKPFPDWFFAGGGVSTTKPGESISVTQILEPGAYFALNTEGGAPDPASIPIVEVSGEHSEEELEAETTVTASEYKFEAEDLKSGEDQLDFHNAGAQPHHLLIAPLVGDATADDLLKAFRSEGEKPPISAKGGTSTAVLEGGESQLVDVDLKPGRYAFFCFISDRQGGPPHAIKGMVDEFEVK